ncbi:MAG: hypothetical protein ACRDTU_06895 [Micromonosporaceae bacterium]
MVTAGAALVALAACNGLLLWVYDHSSLGVVITLGTFIAAVSLTWLRGRSRQLTTIIVYVQALLVVSIVVGAMVATSSDVFTGILAGGITLVGLVLLSVTGFVFVTGERTRRRTAVALGAATAVVLTMAGSYVYLSLDYQPPGYVEPYVAPPEESVDFLISRGQDYHDDGAAPAAAERAFNRYVCDSARQEIAALFASLIGQGDRRLATPEDVTVTARGKRGETRTVTITATMHVIDDIEGRVLDGPETWTFHLWKGAADSYWKAHEIDRPGKPAVGSPTC